MRVPDPGPNGLPGLIRQDRRRPSPRPSPRKRGEGEGRDRSLAPRRGERVGVRGGWELHGLLAGGEIGG